MKQVTMSFVNILAVSSTLIISVNANEFLKWLPHEFIERVSEEEIQKSLLNEIENSLPDPLGTSSASKLFSELEATLQPIYAALPKNTYGNLEHSAASYALHRLFLLRHGWAITGLGPASGKYNTSSPAGILKDQVPAYIEDLFERHLGGKGFSSHDLTVLAATIEHLIQEEAVSRLGAAFKLHEANLIAPGILSYSDTSVMLDTYMIGYILAQNLTDLTSDVAKKLRAQMQDLFNFWTETQEFVRGIQKDVVQNASRKSPFPSAARLDFTASARVVERVVEQFGTFFHDTVCSQLKTTLMRLEHRNSGRIRLSEFYKPALDGYWQFQESVGYLRESGVLEENNSTEASVMIANYMVAPSNCIAPSGFYSVCCRNECEDLLGHLEKEIAAPEAKPETIASLVAELPSSSSVAPGPLSSTSRRRLDQIAEQHGGMVPLHSRLFLQWMHHTYPRECPYPHMSGVTSVKQPEDWLLQEGGTASKEEMLKHTQRSDQVVDSANDANIEDLRWSPEEELIVVRPIVGAPPPSWFSTTMTLRSLVLFAVVASFSYVFVHSTKGGAFGIRDTSYKLVV